MATGPGKLRGRDRREEEREGVCRPGDNTVGQVGQVGRVPAPAVCPGHAAAGLVSWVLIRHCSEHLCVSPHFTRTAACECEVGALVSPISK